MKSNEMTYKAKMTTTDLSAMLRVLLKSMEEGTVVLEAGEKFVVLKPADNIEVTVEASTKKDKEKLEISLSWENVPCVCKSAGLKITSKVPVAPATEPAPAKPAEKTPEAKKV